MKKEVLKIATIFLITIGVVLWGLNFIFFKGNAPKSKATGETITFSFNPATKTAAANTDFTVSLMAKPSTNTVLRGYLLKVGFDETKVKFKSIVYKLGVVSAGLGDTNAQAAAINGDGTIEIIGESTTAVGNTVTAVNGVEIATLTFTALSTAGSSISTSSSAFFSIEADKSLFDGWTSVPGNLSVNSGGVTNTPTPTPTPSLKYCTVSVSGNSVSFSGANAPSGNNVKLWLARQDKVAINPAPANQNVYTEGAPLNYTGYLVDSCNVSAAGSCSKTYNVPSNLPVGNYYFHCDIQNDPSKCSGQPFCDHEKPLMPGGKNCTAQGYRSCSNNDNVAYTKTNVTPSPTPTGGAGNVKLNLKIKFQGISKLPATGENSMTVKVNLKKEIANAAGDLTESSGTFTSDDKGVWSGTVGFDATKINPINVTNVLYIKGPQHLQKKICDNTPPESNPGTYRCSDGKITLAVGDNNLDFSGILLLAGDLDQSGIVDSVDFGMVRNNLGKTDAATLAQADINRDGKVDTQDFSLIIAALGIRTDEL